jgi:branched-chain amino acid transport system substrate-binding protein
MKRMHHLLAGILILSTLLGACVTTETPTVAPTQPPAAQPPAATEAGPTEAAMPAPEVIKIGALYPLTGAVAATGVASKEAIEFAADIVNNAYPDLNLPLAKDAGLPNLGGATIEVIFADHQMDPEIGASETERLITEEHVVAIEGAYASSVTNTASQAAERLGIPFVNAQSTSPGLTDRGFQWYFRTTPHDGIFSELMFKFLTDMKETKGIDISSVVTIHENTLFGTDSSTTQQNFAAQYGFNVLEDIAYPHETADMTSEVQKLKADNPDVVLPTSYISDAILMVRTFKDQGYAPQAILAQGVGFTEGSFLPTLGTDGDYILSREVFAADLADVKPLVGQVNDLFKEKYGRELEGATARSFTALLVLADAINRAGSTDPEAIRQALLATDIPADQLIMPWEGVRFDPETHQNVLGTGIIVQAFDGAYHTVWPFDLATREIVWPYPAWSDR